MRRGIVVLIAIVGLIALLCLQQSAFQVAEHEQVIITEFGKPVGGPITDAGFHWKTPFAHTVHRFEKRLLEHDGDATEIPTRDKKFIFVDTFARWRIADPLLFYQSVRDEGAARTRLDDIIDSETRDSVSNHYLIEVVRNTKRKLQSDAEIEAAAAAAVALPAGTEPGAAPEAGLPAAMTDGEPTTIERGREAIAREILTNAAKKIQGLGIELVDVQIKSVNYTERVRKTVYDRMVSERQQIADKYRAEGRRSFSDIQGRIAKERDRILSEAYRRAETLKGEAEAQAARIYAEAYGRDPEFYSFWRTLELYREHFADNVSLVLSTDSDLFRLLRGAGIAGPKQGN